MFLLYTYEIFLWVQVAAWIGNDNSCAENVNIDGVKCVYSRPIYVSGFSVRVY